MSKRPVTDRDTTDRFFDEALRKFTLHAICGRPYVRVKKLKEWLCAIRPETGLSNFRSIIHKTFSNDSYKWSLESLLKDKPMYLVFSILLTIGQEKLLSVFGQHKITDDRLPMSLAELEQVIEDDMRLQNGKQIAKDFDHMQWSFRPAVLHIEEVSYRRQWILPIHHKTPLQVDSKGHEVHKGGTAKLYQIVVLEEFLSKQLKEVIPRSCYDETSDDLGPVSLTSPKVTVFQMRSLLILFQRYELVLKTFTPENVSFYRNEVQIFQILQGNEGFVRYLGSYSRKEVIRSATGNPKGHDGAAGEQTPEQKFSYNILLQYGDFDLDDYFKESLPPVLQAEIDAFWSDLFQVADGLEGIHHLKIGVENRSVEVAG